jgi:glutamate-5-semialdehyde dehydrogenase
MTLQELCWDVARRAKEASYHLAQIPSKAKDAWLRECASLLEEKTPDILRANERDLEQAENLNGPMRERLILNPKRIQAMANGLREVAGLPDPVGQVRQGSIRPNGLEVKKISVPLGVIFFLYESRPNVTSDAAGICLKSGNAVILRGGKEAQHTNTLVVELLRSRLKPHDLPEESLQLVPTQDREAVGHFLQMAEFIDLCIPRGGESLIRRVVAEAKMPVLKHYLGNCHVYVDSAADLEMAEKIVINAKCSRPSVCNAAESLLIHEAVVKDFLPKIGEALRVRGVEIRGCEIVCSYLPYAIRATEADHASEFCDLVISVKIVSDLNQAITHINRYGSKHTDAIITRDLQNSRRFIAGVDSAAVMVNASTRFNDGGELGLGAEIGISTDKFHARGPCGLVELTTSKYIVIGEGHIRE